MYSHNVSLDCRFMAAVSLFLLLLPVLHLLLQSTCQLTLSLLYSFSTPSYTQWALRCRHAACRMQYSCTASLTLSFPFHFVPHSGMQLIFFCFLPCAPLSTFHQHFTRRTKVLASKKKTCKPHTQTKIHTLLGNAGRGKLGHSLYKKNNHGSGNCVV